MGSCYKLLDRALYVAKPAISCSSSTRATFLSPPKLVPALPLKRVPVDSSSFSTDFFGDTHLLKLRYEMIKIKGCSGYGGAHSTTCSVSMSSETLRWVFTGAAALLLLLKNTGMRKAFLVPMLVLQAPQGIIHWVRGEYGIWAAFLALLVRLFYYIPGELELPLVFVLLTITAPYQVMDLRGSTAALVVCAGVAAFLAYQHFSGAGGLKGSFKEGTILPSVAAICLIAVPIIFLVGVV